MVARSPDGSHFVGSTATMPDVELVLREMGLGEAEVRELTWARPRQVLGYS
jgi:hypothetical protein